MDRFRILGLRYLTLPIVLSACSLTAQGQWEHLNRGLVAMKNGNKTFVSWRVLQTDAPGVTFDLLRNGQTVKNDLKVSNSELTSI